METTAHLSPPRQRMIDDLRMNEKPTIYLASNRPCAIPA